MTELVTIVVNACIGDLDSNCDNVYIRRSYWLGNVYEQIRGWMLYVDKFSFSTKFLQMYIKPGS